MEEERERAFKIVYDEAIRALDLQRAGIDSLRARVGFLVSAAAISTSFLGGLALAGGDGDSGSWVAIALFVAFGAVSLRVLWPGAESAEGFTTRPSALVAGYIERPDGSPPEEPWAIYRAIAAAAERAYALNRSRHQKPLSRYFRLAIVLLSAEIAAWIIDLAARYADFDAEDPSDGQGRAAEFGSRVARALLSVPR